MIAWFDAAAGLVDILEGLIPREPSVIHWMEQFLPMDVSESSRLGMYLTGLSLLPIARGPAFHHIVLALALLGLLIWRRRDYVAGSDRPSIRWALIIGLPILIGVIVYGVVGLLRLRAELIGKNNLRAAVQGTEMTFDLGSFDLERIRKDGVAAIFNAEGKLEAFATWLSYRQGRGRCLDLMRSYPEPKGVMDFLIVESIDHFKGLGVEEVSLGNAPLANAEQDPCLYGREEKAVKFLFERFNRYYGYKSLFEFKKKYQPSWQGRYLGFRPNVILCSLRLR